MEARLSVKSPEAARAGMPDRLTVTAVGSFDDVEDDEQSGVALGITHH